MPQYSFGQRITNLWRTEIRPLHCCIPQTAKENTEAHTHTRALCTGKNISFQDLNATLLQGKTGAKKHQPTWKEQREPKRSSIPICNLSPFRGPHGHTCTIKTSTFHQKTKCMLYKHTCSTRCTHLLKLCSYIYRGRKKKTPSPT